jgi:hypothetical protein
MALAFSLSYLLLLASLPHKYPPVAWFTPESTADALAKPDLNNISYAGIFCEMTIHPGNGICGRLLYAKIRS